MLHTREISALMKAVAGVVRDHVGKAVEGINSRINGLQEEISKIPAGPPGDSIKGDPGDSVTVEDVQPLISDLVSKAIADLPPPERGEDGKDGIDGVSVTPEQVAEELAPLVDDVVAKAVAALPPPPAGKDAPSLEELSDVIKTAVTEVVPTIEANVLKELEAKIPEPVAGKDGADGKDAEIPVDLVKDLVQEHVAAAAEKALADLRETVTKAATEAVAGIPVPQDGKDGKDGRDAPTAEELQPVVESLVSRSFEEWTPKAVEAVSTSVLEALPEPQPGKDGENGKDADPEVIKEMVAKAVSEIPAPKDGQNGRDADPVDMEVVQATVVKAVAEAVAEIPPPKDGKDVPIEVVNALVAGEVAKAIAAMPRPRDGEHGRDATQITPIKAIDEERSYARGTWARHKGGLWMSTAQTKGMEGWECMVEGIHTADFDYDGERGMSAMFTLSSGEIFRKEFQAPVMIDRGIYKQGNEYLPGDVVTSGGSTWVCTGEVVGYPGEPNGKGWRLQVRKGRDGKDGTRGEKGEQGSEGRAGRDLTQMDAEGRKW